MRLINADGLKVFFDDWYDSDKFTVGDIMKVIENQPTVEAESVRHGHWIDNDIDPEAWNFCSVCGEQAIDNYDYCPNCGAKMDGGE